MAILQEILWAVSSICDVRSCNTMRHDWGRCADCLMSSGCNLQQVGGFCGSVHTNALTQKNERYIDQRRDRTQLLRKPAKHAAAVRDYNHAQKQMQMMMKIQSRGDDDEDADEIIKEFKHKQAVYKRLRIKKVMRDIPTVRAPSVWPLATPTAKPTSRSTWGHHQNLNFVSDLIFEKSNSYHV